MDSTDYITYKEVEATAQLTAAGIVDLLRAPADGVDRNTHLNWDGATFGVKANEEEGRPDHQVIMHYRLNDGRQGTQAFAIEPERGVVATTSGSHPEGCRPLSPQQRTVLVGLVKASQRAGVDGPSGRDVAR